MEDIQYDRGEFYSHSGKCSLLLLCIIPIVLIISLLLAFVYNWAVIYIPFVGYLSIVLTIGYALIIGLSFSFFLYLFKVRNIWLARILAVCCACLAFYLAWAVFTHLFLRKFSPDSNLSFINILLNPVGIWAFACEIAEKGWFSIKSITPSGWALWGLWGIEALIILIIIFMASEAAVRNSVFCENCNKWTDDTIGVVVFDLEEDGNLIDQFLNHDFSFLQYAIRAKSTAVNYFRIDSSICGHCQDFFVLSLLHVNKTYDKNETETLHETYLVRHLMIHPDDFSNLIEMRKVMHQAVTPTNLTS